MMPAKDSAVQAAAAKRHYDQNKAAIKARAQEWTNQRRIEAHRYVRELKEASPCMDCGVSYPSYVMDFDHRDPGDKRDCIAKLCNRGVSWKRLLDEIAKCDLVCANCHRERTHGPSTRGGAVRLARQAHNLKVGGSNPPPAT